MEDFFLLFIILVPFALVGLLIWLVLKVRSLERKFAYLVKQQSVWSRTDEVKGRPVSAQTEVVKDPAQAEQEKESPTKDQPLSPHTEQSVSVKINADAHPAEPGIQETFRTESDTESNIAGAPKVSLLDRLTDIRILIWIGGSALALGGVFVVKYSFEHELLGPWGRVLAGGLLGLVMLAASEWLRRQEDLGSTRQHWSYLPLIVSAAGFVTLYGAIFAGYALYQLFSPLIALLLMAVVAASGLVYSLLLGPPIALLAVIGAYLVPLLVSTENPSTEMLYLYLGGVMAGSFLFLRYRQWPFIAGVNLLFAVLWFLMWLVFSSVKTAEIMVLTIYGCMVLGLYLYQFAGPVSGPRENGWRTLYRHPEKWAVAAVAFVGFIGLALAFFSNYLPASLALPFLLLPITAWASSRNGFLETSVWIGQASLLIYIGLWPEGSYQNGVLQPDLAVIIWSALGGAFYVLMAGWRLKSGISAFNGILYAVYMPLLIFCLLFWKYNGFGTSLEWSVIALVLAGGYVGAASTIRQKMSEEAGRLLVGLLAAGGTGGLSLALAAALEAEWLTIAFALQVLALGWIHRHIPIRIFRPIASLLAIIVIVRLEMDSELFRFLFDASLSVDWYLYGLGVPLVAFLVSRHIFGKEKQDYLTGLLESGAVLFWVSLIALTVRQWMSGSDVGFLGLSFAEASIHVVSWLLNALGLYWLASRRSNPVREWAWKILGAFGLGVLVFGTMLLLNPMISRSGEVGSWYLINWLSFGYIGTAVILLMGTRVLRSDHLKYGPYIVGLAGLLGFWYLNTEIRHFFNGPDMLLGSVGETEMYAYSVGWLCYAGAGMGLGIARDRHRILQAALLLLLLTAVKVFFFDMSALEGLLRAASFLGLGIVLIGLAFLYQRFGKKNVHNNP
ncbi:DUF2339 domain-containing protein [Sneathiella aquimaris]|uniref:DUF2339 domain-containing protein n=1 Tax=Sneathiella aquimaris TaxID=2599305 RepID=UPI00146F5C42|nr:DUF2339 domain-containing protein [Sneathiella aquimaris]